jgi:hypothetical protein
MIYEMAITRRWEEYLALHEPGVPEILFISRLLLSGSKGCGFQSTR